MRACKLYSKRQRFVSVRNGLKSSEAVQCSSAHRIPSSSRRALLVAGIFSATLPFQSSSKADEAIQASGGAPTPVYFGNGCFWGRQKDFIDAEKSLGRADEELSAVVGYAGGTERGPSGAVCYYYSDPRTIYERLGHAEVVQVRLDPDSEAAQQQFRRFAEEYFKDFRQTKFGMQRLDPQDAGPGYRNVVGIPGGVKSPLFSVLQEANKYGMELRPGQGGKFLDGQPREDDLLNVVWVVDSDQLPFYRAERWHQFHNGLGKAFPAAYTQKLKSVFAKEGKIDPTGCPELPF